VKIHCSVLAEDAIKSAIHDYQEKNGLAHDHDHADIKEHAQA
jgi:nitrogen fixation NifU-like protein